MLGGESALNIEHDHVIKAPGITRTCQNLFSPPRLSILRRWKSYRCWARIIAEAWPGCLEHLENTPVYRSSTRFSRQARLFPKLLLSALTTPTPPHERDLQRTQCHEPAHWSRPQRCGGVGKAIDALASRLMLSSRRRRRSKSRKRGVLSFSLFALSSAIMDRERAVFSRFILAATRSWRAAELSLPNTTRS